MTQKFECIEKHLYRRQYQTAGGDWSTVYYARFVDWKGKRRIFPLGSKLETARKELNVYEARNWRKEDFDADKTRDEGMAFGKWSEIYFGLEEVKRKRSLDRDRQHVGHLKKFFASTLLFDFTREKLFEYRNLRLQEKIIRHGEATEKKVSPGTVKNELSCLRHMLKLASEKGLKIAALSFRGVIDQGGERERVLRSDEYTKLLNVCPSWLKRICIVAYESCLSEGDLLRLTADMINEHEGVIEPEGGRTKTGVRQVSPITPAIRSVLNEIKAERAKVANVSKLLFTRDGQPVTKDMLRRAVATALKKAGIKNFTFHDFRHTAKTRWAKNNIPVDVAMLAAGHKSVAMHQRYIHIQSTDVASIFKKMATTLLHENEEGDKISVSY